LRIAWIKDCIGFLCAILATVSIFSYFVFAISERGPFFLHGSTEDIAPILNSFRQAHRPIVEVNFSALYGGNGQFQVLHPLLDMRNLRSREENPTCSDDDETSTVKLEQMSRGFIEHLNEKSLDDEFPQKKQANRKLEALEQFLNRGGKLPDDFVVTPPFIDDWGNSFAYLLTQKGPPPYNEKNWVEQHLSFFKISELEKVLNKYQINDLKYWTISHLAEPEIEDIVKADSLVVTKDYLFLKNQSRFGFSPLSYWVYDIRDFRIELKNTKYELSTFAPGSICLQKTGNGCWTYSSKHAMAYLFKYSVAIVVLIGFIVVICLSFYFRHLYEKSREQNKNRLALQVLSHEFRTPVSSMLLMIEQLSKKQKEFDIADQDLLTRISTEVFRLQRIIEVSKTYLQTESHRVHFNYIDIPSINSWVSDFASEINPDVCCELLPNDQSIKADPFWLKFILSNLVQNAFLHGKPAVFIRLNDKDGKVKITVEDQGKCEFNSLNQMTDAFVKSSRSKGMGLGLNIVKFILDDWGVDIKFSKLPTSFSLFFSEVKRG